MTTSLYSPYSRYFGVPTLSMAGELYLAGRPVPPAQAYPDALIHVCTEGDTLDQLAKLYYGREDLWWRIADANPRRFPFDLSPGDELVVPPLRVATRTPRGGA